MPPIMPICDLYLYVNHYSHFLTKMFEKLCFDKLYSGASLIRTSEMRATRYNGHL